MRDKGQQDSPAEDEASLTDFRYYMFDWDDNILHMPTKIYLERRQEDGRWESHPVSTGQFALIRRDMENYRPTNGNWDDAFVEFYDVGSRGEGAFLEDCKSALRPIVSGSSLGGPSFNRFRKALVEGRLFAIITARAHSPYAIRKGVEYFIENILNQEEKAGMIDNLRRYNAFFDEENSICDKEVLRKYLSLNKYLGVTSSSFLERMGLGLGGSPQNPATAKQFAIREFVQHVVDLVGRLERTAPISIGFSDDDVHNVQAVVAFIEQELSVQFPDVRFVVYDTSDPALPRGQKVVIRGQLEFDINHLPDDA